ncbi:hypothetical protein EMIHUDRAFT_441183 [Emiliania huxleyi CCMP1516]|uniref:Uncharacterized protein n=2 Tax=Emiliania huxleyi TaxID=2903 RepID=A0A0D3KG91_EMIH1|nr:hypothetical protein EMIHUDRAFT_441183 [Emiliania huxleyi CCMP1516]EOD34776.1 hypothetical protein EMIHUDRAFT_441183 [Emiliania huxleyi CCMP1516]|eukprot:XP_005787205.1 hypothetical protein EMIHUDRAFT_441183 [Emiliania huxleyi CCMP1516]
MARRMPLLSRLRIFEDADAWRRIGFNVSEAGVAHVGGVDIELAGADCRDPAGWEFRSREGSGSRLKVDGISTRMSRFDAMSQTWTWEAGEAEHSNAAVGLYSVLVTAGDLQRTVQAMSESIFGPPARLLEKSPFSPKLSMAFFEAGSPGGTVVVEVLAPRTPGQVATLPGFPPIGGDPDAPARLAGLVVTVPSLEPVGELLGEDALGYPRPAAQGQGRVLAPLKHARVGLRSMMAFMTPPDREELEARAKAGTFGKGLAAHLSTGNTL